MKAILKMGGLLALLAGPLVAAEGYDPLRVAKGAVESGLYEVKDDKRQRTIPLRVYLPAAKEAAPVVLFSHGLGGSRDNNVYLGEHWAKRGYVVVFVQHPGSDEGVWKEVPARERMAAMRRAASAENYLARTMDVPVALDALTIWNEKEGHPLQGRLDLEKIGMSGHSFGAQTTQAMAGQVAVVGRQTFSKREPRIDAAVMMSPSPPARGDAAAAFAEIKIPCLLMTGTLDDSLVGNTTPEDRLKVFPHLKQAAAWQVVFDKATHGAFSERPLPGEPAANPRYHKAILALTTAFWDAELKGDGAAREWLKGDGAKGVLAAEDRWEKNVHATADGKSGVR